jgi:hypothetical protein
MMIIPDKQLRKFSQDREKDTPASFGARNIQINRDRVEEFIEEPLLSARRGTADVLSNRLNQIAASGLLVTHSKSTLSGIYDYPTNTYLEERTKPRTIQLQSVNEFRDVLGCRSRFGEGDGSFFDKWLNIDLLKSKHIVDEKTSMPGTQLCYAVRCSVLCSAVFSAK